MTNTSRAKSTAARLLSQSKSSSVNEAFNKQETVFEPNKKNITKLINDQGSSIRVADSIRINPILSASLKYLTTIVDSSKSKPDIIEDALIKYIPEDILIEGYKIAKKQNKI